MYVFEGDYHPFMVLLSRACLRMMKGKGLFSQFKETRHPHCIAQYGF